MSSEPHVLVVAKAPVPGRVKTRLCPPCTPTEAAELAEAALVDTLEAVVGCGAGRRLLALEGCPGEWLPAGFTVFPQTGATFAERLARAWADAGGRGLQIGMDTPQVTPAILDGALDRLDGGGSRALLGRAEDGGWWALGLPQARPDAFAGVPMSTRHTGTLQGRRLVELGFEVVEIETLRDVDEYADALAVAARAPGTHFAEKLRDLGLPRTGWRL